MNQTKTKTAKSVEQDTTAINIGNGTQSWNDYRIPTGGQTDGAEVMQIRH